jgi:hypothetical protein
MSRVARTLVGAAALVALLVAVGFVVELLRSNFVWDPVSANYVTLPFGANVAALIIGVVLVWQRPGARAGMLLAIAAALNGLAYYRFSTHPWLAVIGLVVFFAASLLPLHAAVEAGEGVGRAGRRLLAGGHAAMAALGVAIAMTAPSGAISRWFVAADSTRHVENMFLLVESRSAARALFVTWWVVLLAIGAIAIALRARRWRHAPGRVRRTEAPAVVGSFVWLVLVAGGAATLFIERKPGARSATVDLATIALPALALAVVGAVVGWVELVEPRLARRGGAIDLADSPAERTDLRQLLADLLASPNVEVAYAVDGGWIDTNGRAIDFERMHRHHLVVRAAGEAIAAIIHDRDVPADAVQLGARITVAHLLAERATALARARAEAVRTAAGDLVRAGDRAAQAVAHDMLAGPVPELVRIAAQLRTDPASLPDVKAALKAVTAQVREISHGLLPRELESGGLRAVLHGRTDVERRLPAVVEITVYLLAYGDPTARVTDNGEEILVRRTAPFGGEGAARTAALGGTIDGTVATVPVAAGREN